MNTVLLVQPAYPVGGLVERSLDLLFPPLCVGCRRVGRWICPRCWPAVSWLRATECGLCGRPSMSTPCPRCAGGSHSLDAILAVVEFDGLGREAVHALKYHERHAISGLLGRLMAESARSSEATLVVPTRLHPRRRRERGYDQASLLGAHVARSLRIQHAPRVLRRTRYTRQQALLDGDDRRHNVAGAFNAATSLVGQRVLLVDDVMTTGATLSAAAEAMKAAGAESVCGLVFALAM